MLSEASAMNASQRSVLHLWLKTASRRNAARPMVPRFRGGTQNEDELDACFPRLTPAACRFSPTAFTQHQTSLARDRDAARDEAVAGFAARSGGHLGLRHMGGDGVHQGWRQAVIGLQPKFFQPAANFVHLPRVDAGFDHRGNKGRKARGRGSGFLEQFGMDEVEAIEGMALVLDAAIHMRAADLAGIALDHRGRIDDLQLVAVLEHRHVLTGYHGDDREHRALWLPAFGATAGVIMRHVALDADLDRLVLAFADQGAAAEAARAFLHAAVDRWVELNAHESFLLVFCVVIRCLRMISPENRCTLFRIMR